MDKEVRLNENQIEIRVSPEGKETISGYALVFNTESRDLGGFREVIKPEALRNTDMSDVVALFNHDSNLILGRTPQTLSLSVDERGLRYDIDPPDTTAGNDLKVSIARGDVRGSSFGFTVAKDGDKWDKPKEKGAPYMRTVTGIAKLWDVSPVTSPAYDPTDVSISKRELGMLRDAEEREVTDAIEKENELAKIRFMRQQRILEADLKFHDDEDKMRRIEEEERKRIELERRRRNYEFNTLFSYNDKNQDNE